MFGDKNESVLINSSELNFYMTALKLAKLLENPKFILDLRESCQNSTES